MVDILDFVRVEPDARLWQAVKRTAELQRVYVGSHEYDLHTFGLKNEQIRKDFDLFYQTFLLP